MARQPSSTSSAKPSMTALAVPFGRPSDLAECDLDGSIDHSIAESSLEDELERENEIVSRLLGVVDGELEVEEIADSDRLGCALVGHGLPSAKIALQLGRSPSLTIPCSGLHETGAQRRSRFTSTPAPKPCSVCPTLASCGVRAGRIWPPGSQWFTTSESWTALPSCRRHSSSGLDEHQWIVPGVVWTSFQICTVALHDRKRLTTSEDTMTKNVAREAESPSQLIDARIKELGDWRGEMLSRIRRPDQASRSRGGRGVEVEGGSDVVPRRDDLHG